MALMGVTMRPPPPPMRAPRPERKFNIKNKLTYRFVKEEYYPMFEKAIQEFIEANPDYEIMENPPFKFDSGSWLVATFKLKECTIKSKTTIKD